MPSQVGAEGLERQKASRESLVPEAPRPEPGLVWWGQLLAGLGRDPGLRSYARGNPTLVAAWSDQGRVLWAQHFSQESQANPRSRCV